jgi:hypothetical protein
VFPNTTAQQRANGMTDFNDLASVENGRLAKRQLEEAVWFARYKNAQEKEKLGKGVIRLDSWAGRDEVPCDILKETPHRFLVRLGEDCLLPGGRRAKEGQEVYVPKDVVERVQEQSMEASR